MATHDYNIANQSASAFRGDLNNVLQAILTQNSGATAPTTTAADMLWYDTTAKQLKKRNEANSAWIILGTISEANSTFTPSGDRSLASQAQAETGTNNTTVMTPLRVSQAITALAPAYVLLGTLTTTSGVTQTLAGLTLTPYKFLRFVFNGVSISAVTYFRVGTSGPNSAYIFNPTDSISGFCDIDLVSGLGIVSTAGGETRSEIGFTGFTTASTSVFIKANTGTFDAGTVRIYGIK